MTVSDLVTTEADGHLNNQESSGSHWGRWGKKQDNHPLLSLYGDNYPIPSSSKELPHPQQGQEEPPHVHPVFSRSPPSYSGGGHLPRVAVLQAHSQSEEAQMTEIAPLCSPHREGLQPTMSPNSSAKPFRCLDAPCSIVLSPKTLTQKTFTCQVACLKKW